jgi:hypothetical protein
MRGQGALAVAADPQWMRRWVKIMAEPAVHGRARMCWYASLCGSAASSGVGALSSSGSPVVARLFSYFGYALPLLANARGIASRPSRGHDESGRHTHAMAQCARLEFKSKAEQADEQRYWSCCTGEVARIVGAG